MSETLTAAEFLAPVAEYFKVLSEISRLQIVSCLKSGAMNVSEIGAATGLGQANLSKHLKLVTAECGQRRLRRFIYPRMGTAEYR